MALETVVAANTSVRPTLRTAPQSPPATLGTRETHNECTIVFRVHTAPRSRRRNGEITTLFIGTEGQGRTSTPRVSLEYAQSYTAETLYH